jgi:hypothetical protein
MSMHPCMEARSESDPTRTATKGVALFIIDPAGAADGAILDQIVLERVN